SFSKFFLDRLNIRIQTCKDFFAILRNDLPSELRIHVLDDMKNMEEVLIEVQEYFKNHSIMECDSMASIFKQETVKKIDSLIHHMKSTFNSHLEYLISFRHNHEKFEQWILQNSKLVFCTASSAGRKCVRECQDIEIIIVDEAPQLPEAHSL